MLIMPKDVEIVEENTQVRVPAPVRIALGVLSTLSTERSEKLRKALPAYAMTLTRQGKEVTEQVLRDALAKGDDVIMGPRPAFKKAVETAEARYVRVLADFKRHEFDDNPAFTAEKRLLSALWRGDMPLVRELVDAGRAAGYYFKIEMWHKALRGGHIEAVEYLFEQKFHAEKNNFSGDHLIIDDPGIISDAACSLEMIRIFVDHGADILWADSMPLRAAARNGHLDVVKFLIEKGCDIAACDNQPLYFSAWHGHLDVVRYLVAQGADIHAGGDLALCKAVEGGHLDVVKFLVEQGCGLDGDEVSAMYLAAIHGHLPIMKYLVDQGVDIAKENCNILAAAIARGYLDVAEFLVEKGADVNASGGLALRGAVNNDHLEGVKFLLKNGASPQEDLGGLLINAIGYKNYNVYHYLSRLQADCERQSRMENGNLHGIIKAIDLWLETVGTYPPRGLEDKAPGSFDIFAIKPIGDLLCRKEDYPESTANKYAYMAIKLFGTAERVMDYFEKWAKPGFQPLHDVAQTLFIPDTALDLKSWADAVMSQGPEMAKLLKFADKISQPLKGADGKTWSLSKTRDEAAKFAYKNGAKNQELAVLFNKYQMSEGDFEDARKVVKAYKPKTKNRIPDIVIDGKSFGMDGAQFKKLPDGDLRGLVLGQITNCCQSIGGAGEDCAKHGFKSENGGFYIVAVNDNKKDEEIIGQSWAWRGTGGELVLDSLETLGGRVNKDQWQKLVTAFAGALEKTDVTSLHVGAGGATPQLPFERSNSVMPRDYSGYRDSNSQYQVWKRN